MSEPGTENPKPVLGSLRFENTRFDPDLTPFHELAKDMATQFGYAAELSGDRVLLQLLRLRVAQLNLLVLPDSPRRGGGQDRDPARTSRTPGVVA